MIGDEKEGALVGRQYWDATYETRYLLQPVDLLAPYARCSRQLFSIKRKIGLEDKRVLEIGGGGSPWLAFLAKTFPASEFWCLDYSEVGVNSLRQFAAEQELSNLDFIVADMFDPPLHPFRFDFVFSHGVVEHFQNLPGVLAAHAKYLDQGGAMLTVIPNMAGILGFLTKIFNQQVYDIHVPYDLESLRKGHEASNLDILESGYLCSNNFSVLSSCFPTRTGWKWSAYKFLSRVSKMVGVLEDKFFGLPTSRFFSPYIYVISGHPSNAAESD